MNEWRGTCATPECDVTLILRAPMLAPRQDWPPAFLTPCVGCGRDLYVTSVGEPNRADVHIHTGRALFDALAAAPGGRREPLGVRDSGDAAYIDSLETQRVELLVALTHAVTVIETWHSIHDANDAAWVIYRDNAPEMKLINTAIRRTLGQNEDLS